MAMHLHALFHDIEEMCDKNWRKSAQNCFHSLWVSEWVSEQAYIFVCNADGNSWNTMYIMAGWEPLGEDVCV